MFVVRIKKYFSHCQNIIIINISTVAYIFVIVLKWMCHTPKKNNGVTSLC